MKRSRHLSGSPYESKIGFARAVRTGDRIMVSDTAPIGPEQRTVAGDAMVVVAALLDPAWRVEIEAEALLDQPED